MKIATWNMNGYRSAEKINALENLVSNNDPDIICLQEIKMNDKLYDELNYNTYYNFAFKKGYSGSVVMTKIKPLNVVYDIGLERFDREGRFLLLEFEDFVLINIYIPHGGRNKENHPYKFEALDNLIKLIKGINKNLIICGDFNIAHTELDLKNYKTNYNNNMFSFPERAKIDEILSLGLVDSFRVIEKDGDIYSAWPNAYNARERNMGWRIDYIFVSEVLKDKIKSVKYLKEQLGSDHAPCVLCLDKCML